MRLISTTFIALIALSTLAACGTKTPLSLPPQPQPAPKVSAPPVTAPEGPAARTVPGTDSPGKTAAESRQ